MLPITRLLVWCTMLLVPAAVYGQPQSLVTPRYAKFSIDIDF